jgi:hypothetical protein
MKDEMPLETQAVAQAGENAWALAEQPAAKMKAHITHLERATRIWETPNRCCGEMEMGAADNFQLMTANNRRLTIHSRRVEVAVTLEANFAVE